jgi:hypothetical protein
LNNEGYSHPVIQSGKSRSDGVVDFTSAGEGVVGLSVRYCESKSVLLIAMTGEETRVSMRRIIATDNIFILIPG